jgi:hypothetical protein
MSLMRCLIHDVVWDSDNLEDCPLCTWAWATQSPTDHQADDPPACVSTLAQS